MSSGSPLRSVSFGACCTDPARAGDDGDTSAQSVHPILLVLESSASGQKADRNYLKCGITFAANNSRYSIIRWAGTPGGARGNAMASMGNFAVKSAICLTASAGVSTVSMPLDLSSSSLWTALHGFVSVSSNHL